MKQTIKKPLPQNLTSYDLLKTLAVALMILDHVGYYFFPEENWIRVFGRMCVPAWFFLIGYANSRDMGVRMWIGAGLLVVGDLVTGLYVFPLNILATMLIVRALLDPVMAWAMRGASQFWAIFVLLFLLALPSSFFFEYGTLAIIMAIYGYLLRHRGALVGKHKDLPMVYLLASLGAFVAIQSFTFGFDQMQINVLFFGIFAVLAVLYFFRPAEYPRLTATLPLPVVWFLQLTGRRTLEIYVAHLLLFKTLGLGLGDERFGLFNFRVFYEVNWSEPVPETPDLPLDAVPDISPEAPL